MSPTADARTGRKAYADCRRDCRNTGINIQRGLRKVNTRALLPAFLCSVPQLGRPLSPWTVIQERSDRITIGPTLRRVGLYCKAPRARLRHPRAALATEPRKRASAPRGHYP
jgi:hypothetical protein